MTYADVRFLFKPFQYIGASYTRICWCTRYLAPMKAYYEFRQKGMTALRQCALKFGAPVLAQKMSDNSYRTCYCYSCVDLLQ